MTKVQFGLLLALIVCSFAGAAPAPPAPATQSVQTYPLNTFVNVLDGQWLGVYYASDGNTYFGSSTHDAHHGAAFFKYDPRTGKLTELSDDITKICGEDPYTNPQGKLHSPIAEANGWIYFSTYFGNDATPGAYANYTGSHVIGYQLSTGQFRDYGVILSNYTSYSAVGIEPTGRYVYVFVTGELPGQISYLFRVDTQTGAKVNLGQVGTTYNADFDMFVDQNGYVWFSVDSGDSSEGGILQRYNPNTKIIEEYYNELPPLYDSMTGLIDTDQSSRHIHWMQGIDSTHAVFTLGYYGGRIYELDTTKTPGSGQEFTFLTDIGFTDLGLAVASTSKKVFYYQRANRGCGDEGDGQPEPYCGLPADVQLQDFHLLSVSYDPATSFAITDYGLLQDQNGRLVWRVPGMATDGNNKVFMVGDWYNLASDPNSYRTYRYDPNGPYTYLDRGEFIASADVSGAAVLPIVSTTTMVPPTVSITAPAAGNVQGTITVSANASASAPATIAGVQFQADGVNLGLEVTAAPYQISWDTTTSTNGSHSLTATAWDSNGGRTASPAVLVTVSNSVAPPGNNSATFIKQDAATQGNWPTAYGRDGGMIANDLNSPPSYAQIGIQGALLYTWNANATDAGSLLKQTSGRIASTWYYPTSFTIDVNLTDGQTHQIAHYLMDYDNQGRTERIDVLDGASGAVLDTRSAANYQSGVYWVWSITGHVQFKITKLTGPNGIVNGFFFGGAGGGGGSNPLTISISSPAAGQTVSGAVNVIAAALDSAGVPAVQFKLNGANLGSPVTAAPYQVSWNTANSANGAHSLTAVATDAAGNSATAAAVSVTVSNSVVPPGNNSATFLKQDATTQGNWPTAYGRDGGMIANDLNSPPAYAQINIQNGLLYTWNSSPTDAGSLLRQTSGRIASTWYNPTIFTIDVNLTDGQPHQIAHYLRDYDNQGRTEQIDVLDAGTGAILDTRTASSYGAGVYFVWSIGGHVQFRITKTAGPNGIVNGFFFGGAAGSGGDTTPPTVSLTSPANGQSVGGSITIAATASDNVGVAGVQFKVDSTNLGAQQTTAPYSVSWDSTTVSNGTHTLSATASDTAGNTATASVTVTVSNPPAPPASGPPPLAWWTLDLAETSGALALDSSGNGYNLTIANTTSVAGRIHEAMAFNGNNSSLGAYLPAMDLRSSMTFAAFIKTTNSVRSESIISKYDTAGSEFGYLLKTTPAGTLSFRIGGNNSTVGSKEISDIVKINDGQWHYVAVVVNLGLTVTFFVDGVQTSSQPLPSTAGSSSVAFEIGNIAYPYYAVPFTGSIDEVKVFNTALTAAQIASLAAGN